MNVLRKIEMSAMDLDDLEYFQQALENRRIFKGRLFSHIGHVCSPDILVLVADFFMKCHEVGWAVVSGFYGKTLVVVIRNDGLRKNAGTSAIKAFGRFGSAGGHRASARAEIPIANLKWRFGKSDDVNLGDFVVRQFEKRVKMR